MLAQAVSGGVGHSREGDAFVVRTESDAAYMLPGLGRLEAGQAKSNRLQIGL